MTDTIKPMAVEIDQHVLPIPASPSITTATGGSVIASTSSASSSSRPTSRGDTERAFRVPTFAARR
jgi:hypothetical protein